MTDTYAEGFRKWTERGVVIDHYYMLMLNIPVSIRNEILKKLGRKPEVMTGNNGSTAGLQFQQFRAIPYDKVLNATLAVLKEKVKA